jgi:hypothetical protein
MQFDNKARRGDGLPEISSAPEEAPELVTVLIRLEALEVRLELLEGREREERGRNRDSYSEM